MAVHRKWTGVKMNVMTSKKLKTVKYAAVFTGGLNNIQFRGCLSLKDVIVTFVTVVG